MVLEREYRSIDTRRSDPSTMDVETRVYRVPIHHGGEKLRGEIERAEKLVSRMEITEQK